MRRIKAHLTVKVIHEVTKTIHYAASLEVKSWFSIWETKIGYAVLPNVTGTIPATFVNSSDCGMSESLFLADENWYSSNSIDILLGDNVFFVGRRHDKKSQLRNYPVLRGRYIYQGLKELHGKILHSQYWQLRSTIVWILGIWEIA